MIKTSYDIKTMTATADGSVTEKYARKVLRDRLKEEATPNFGWTLYYNGKHGGKHTYEMFNAYYLSMKIMQDVLRV